MIYLDNAATTKMTASAVNAMMPYLTELYGNPGTLYRHGRDAAEAVKKARGIAARFVNAEPEQIIFTAGGSEANNLAMLGLSQHLIESGKTHIITSATEHDSVLNSARELRRRGFDVTFLSSNSEGKVLISELLTALRPETGLVSVMYANNETGAVNPIEEIGDQCARRGVLFHTDCVQAAGCHALDVKRIGCDFLSVSGHKLHGPKGTGVLFAKDKSLLRPLIHGGSEQEFGLRAGTENVAGIVGLGAAIEELDVHETCIWTSTLKQRFFMAIQEQFKELGIQDKLHVNGPSVITPGKTVNIRVDGIDAQSLLLMLDAKGVCCSAGSACTSRENHPSHVLTAMGLSAEEARSSLRFSFSKYNTVEEILEAAETFADCVTVMLGIKKNTAE